MSELSGEAPVPPSCPDEHDVGLRLGDAGRHRADPYFGHQLHVHARRGVGPLGVVDELCEVLDRVDVVVRGRGDEPDAGGRVASPGYPGVHLLRHQLAAFTGLGALGHLDLDVLGVGQVQAGHAETAGGDLLDRGAALRVQQAVHVFAAFTGVGLGAQPVHGDCEGFVGFLGDGAVAHRSGGEALHDAGNRLDFLKRHGGAQGVLELQEPTQGHEVLGLVVDSLGVGLEDVVAAFARGVLEAEDSLRVEQVRFAVAAPLVFAATKQRTVRQLDAAFRVGHLVACRNLGGDDVQADATQLGVGAGEELVHEVLGQAQGFECLGTGVGSHRGNAHLGHDLQDTLAEALDEVVDAVFGSHANHFAGADELLHGFHGQVRVHGGSAEAYEHRHVVRFADVAGLDHQGGLGAVGAAQQVVVYRADEQQGRDRGPLRVGVAVGQHDVLHAAVDRAGNLLADFREAAPQCCFAALRTVESADLHGDLVAVGVLDVGDLGELVVVDHRERQGDLRLADLSDVEKVAVGTDGALQRGHELFADRVQGRVGDLGERLHEVVEQQARALGQHGNRSVGAHGAERFGPGPGHRPEEDLQLLGGVAERPLADVHGRSRVQHVLALG